MLYTFALRRSPLKVVPGPAGPDSHYFGGALGPSVPLDPSRYARVLTLNLRDPLLSILRFPQHIAHLPLLMDFAEGHISYSLGVQGSVVLHSGGGSKSQSLLDGQLIHHPVSLEPIPYEQYRAAVFRAAVIDESFLTEADRSAVLRLGEGFTQVGGKLLRGSGYQPYCSNPNCLGHGGQVTHALASIAQEPAPGISLGFLPYDPALEFSLCLTCHSISGTVIAD